MYLSKNTKASFTFFAPFLGFSFILFCVLYFSGFYHTWGVWNGYGWTTSIWLNFILDSFNLKIRNSSYWLVYGLIYTIVFVPLQELLFRVLPITYFKNKWITVGFFTLFFSLLHLYYMHPVSLILVAFLGVLTAYDYSKNRSFVGIWVFHSLIAYMAFTLNLA